MNVSEIKRKTIAIRGENLQATLMDNIESITASVAQFKKQEKDNPQNDVIALYNNEKENYEQEIEKLTKRLVKQQQQSTQMKEVCDQLTVETEDLTDAIQQYQVQIDKVKDE